MPSNAMLVNVVSVAQVTKGACGGCVEVGLHNLAGSCFPKRQAP